MKYKGKSKNIIVTRAINDKKWESILFRTHDFVILSIAKDLYYTEILHCVQNDNLTGVALKGLIMNKIRNRIYYPEKRRFHQILQFFNDFSPALYLYYEVPCTDIGANPS